MQSADSARILYIKRNELETFPHKNGTFPRGQMALLLATVFVSRLLFALIIAVRTGPTGFLSPDSQGYFELARSLSHGSFSMDGVPEIFRTPGYPLLLLPAVILGHPIFVGLVENWLLAVATTWLIWQIVNDLFPQFKAALWAAIFYCADPVSAVYSERLVSETLFCTQLLLFVWLFLRFLRSPSYTGLLMSSISLAFATYTRPVSIYLGIILVPAVLIFLGKQSAISRLRCAVVFALVFSAALTPWIIRNKCLADYLDFSCAANWNLYFMSAAAVEAKLQHQGFWQVSHDWWNGGDLEQYFQIHPEQRGWSQGSIARFWGAEAKKILLQHPLLYSEIHLRGCIVVLFDPVVTEILKPLRLYPEMGGLMGRTLDQGFFKSALWLFREYPLAAFLSPFLIAQLLVYYVFAIDGLRWLPSSITTVLASFIAYFIVISAVPAATARYRAPVMPLICVAAGVGVAHWRNSCKRAKL